MIKQIYQFLFLFNLLRAISYLRGFIDRNKNTLKVVIGMNKFFDKKTILITGGTGSFGNAMVKKLIKMKVKEIRIFSRDEKNKMI